MKQSSKLPKHTFASYITFSRCNKTFDVSLEGKLLNTGLDVVNSWFSTISSSVLVESAIPLKMTMVDFQTETEVKL